MEGDPFEGVLASQVLPPGPTDARWPHMASRVMILVDRADKRGLVV
jgi:hypothetical protein